MELNITHMIDDSDYMPMLSGSAFELGDNAETITWNNSKEYALKHPLLVTEKQLKQARDYFREFGAWDNQEIAAWSNEEVNALIVQEIAHQIRERELFDSEEEYREAQEQGRISSNIFKTEDNQYYFYMGH